MKVWKTWTGLSLGGRACSRGPKSALFEILQNKDTITNFQKLNFKKVVSKLLDSEKVKRL